MENDDKPRARRRLRQRSPQTATPPKEIISLDSSSDDFVPSSGGERSDSDEGNVNKNDAKILRQAQAQATTSTKKRGFKRLRPADDGNVVGETSQECTPAEPEEWECTRCTYLNEPQRLACEICLTARPMAKQTRKLSAWLTASASTPAKTKASKAARPSNTITPLETIDSSDEGEANHSQSQSQPQSRAPSQKTEDLWATSRLVQSSSVEELCVQKKKVQEVQAWLQQSVPSINSMHGPESMRKRLVFVCGPPGSGKSTTVRHLANVMGVDVKEWRDNATAGKLQYHRYLRDEFQSPQVSAWDDFIDFINRSINYSALQVATVPDNRRSRKRTLQSTSSQPRQQPATARDQLILIESWPENPFGSQDSTIWDEKLKTAFRQIVNPAANLRFPVVCIFSDVRDKKMDAVQLAKVFSDDVVHSPFTSIINFNPVTTAQMKKALLRMLDKMDSTISPQELQKIIDRSDGDIRHATNMVQLLQKRQPLRQKSKHERSTSRKARVTMLSNSSSKAGNEAKHKDVLDDDNDNEDDEDVSRDPFFSDFHIVGKLLHSKNKKPDAASSSSSLSSSSARLTAFDRILDSSAMSLDRVLSLLHSNCADYFTEIDDLEKAVDLMSLSEMWLHGSYRTTSSSLAFKTSHDVVRSVVVRSIALTNDHPAPSAFRPITAPRTYETAKRMVHGRQDALRQLQAMADAGDSAHAYVCKGDVYAFEMQPFVELMRRQSHRPTMMIHMANQNGNNTGAGLDQAVDDDEIENSDGDGW